jgi:mono/diheme cytochrome c family protein
MQQKIGLSLVILATTWFCTTTVYAIRPEDSPSTREKGRLIYQRTCLWCHGAEGKGDGPSGWSIGRFSAPRPRNFTKDGFKFRSTPSGELPSDQDLFRTITRGIPGYMPSFHSLSEEKRWQIIAYLKSFNAAFREETSTPISLSLPTHTPSDKRIENGRKLYLQFECHVCHGADALGDGPESTAGHLRDSNDLRISATNLTNRSELKNGSDPLDLYRSIMTGLDGTPMPSYAAQFAEREQEAWDLVWYLLSLSDKPRR